MLQGLLAPICTALRTSEPRGQVARPIWLAGEPHSGRVSQARQKVRHGSKAVTERYTFSLKRTVVRVGDRRRQETACSAPLSLSGSSSLSGEWIQRTGSHPQYGNTSN
eukprot:62035-Prymnesium_polylepis.1